MQKATQISQVLPNLLNNALEAVNIHEDSCVEVVAIERESELELSVTDSGPVFLFPR